jgi:uncharacterized membrane protein
VNLDLFSWIYRYYVDPIIYDTGYNPVNTITWAVILGIAILALIRLFKRTSLKVDGDFVLSTLPYVLAGSSLRVIEDAGLVQAPASYLLITPFIYLLTFCLTLTSLFLTRKAFGSHYHKAYASVGLIWTLANLSILSSMGVANPLVPLAIFGLGSALSGSLYILGGRVHKLSFIKERFNFMILYAHMLDASSTYVGVDLFGYVEKHVVPTYLIGLIGTAAIMYPLKLLILLPITSVLDSSIEDPSLRNLTKLALIVLGLAPALRNTLRLTLGI